MWYHQRGRIVARLKHRSREYRAAYAISTLRYVKGLVEMMPFPVVAFWNENHFVVVYHATKRYIYVADPIKGRVKYTHEEFAAGWLLEDEDCGVLLAVEPTATFADSKAEREQQKDSFLSILKYFAPYKANFALVFGVMLIVTLLQGVLPFISKAVIDVGIKTSDINFINMVLVGNLTILISVMIFNVLRDWVLIHITARVNNCTKLYTTNAWLQPLSLVKTHGTRTPQSCSSSTGL